MSSLLIVPVVLLVLLAAVGAAAAVWLSLRNHRRPAVHFGPSSDAVAADLEARLAEHASNG